MYIITDYSHNNTPHRTVSSDGKDVHDQVLGITKSMKEANRAYVQICDMSFGHILVGNGYKIECVKED